MATKTKKSYLFKLLDCVQQEAHLECKNYDSCGSAIHDWEDFDVAKNADYSGWIVNKSGLPVCPKCQKKRIKK